MKKIVLGWLLFAVQFATITFLVIIGAAGIALAFECFGCVTPGIYYWAGSIAKACFVFSFVGIAAWLLLS